MYNVLPALRAHLAKYESSSILQQLSGGGGPAQRRYEEDCFILAHASKTSGDVRPFGSAGCARRAVGRCRRAPGRKKSWASLSFVCFAFTFSCSRALTFKCCGPVWETFQASLRHNKAGLRAFRFLSGKRESLDMGRSDGTASTASSRFCNCCSSTACSFSRARLRRSPAISCKPRIQGVLCS